MLTLYSQTVRERILQVKRKEEFPVTDVLDIPWPPTYKNVDRHSVTACNKKLSYCWETVRLESMLRIAEMDVEMTT